MLAPCAWHCPIIASSPMQNFAEFCKIFPDNFFFPSFSLQSFAAPNCRSRCPLPLAMHPCGDGSRRNMGGGGGKSKGACRDVPGVLRTTHCMRVRWVVVGQQIRRGLLFVVKRESRGRRACSAGSQCAQGGAPSRMSVRAMLPTALQATSHGASPNYMICPVLVQCVSFPPWQTTAVNCHWAIIT